MARAFIFYFQIILFIVFSVFSSSIIADDRSNELNLALAYKDFKLEKYNEALIVLNKISGSKKVEATKAYFEGLCYNRLKEYGRGVKAYERAKRLGNKAEDIDYEMGQAYYATNNLDQAIISFGKSAKAKFKVDSSLYYQGFSAQLMEDYKSAKEYYGKILKLPNLTNEMAQATHMQLAEIFLAMSEEKSNQKVIVEKYIIPRLKRAIYASSDSPLVPDISKRLTEIQRRFDLDPNVMLNGRTLPEKRYTFSLTQKMTYDSNITLSTDLPTIQTTQKDAFIFESVAAGRYRFNFLRRFTSIPDFRLNFKKHNNQDSTTVHQNDQRTTTGTLYNTYEHTVFGKMASFLLDYEHNLTNQDRTKTHRIEFFSYYDQATIGERIQIFSVGETSVKGKFKRLKSYSKTIDSNTYTLSADQVVFTSFGHMIMGLFQMDYTRFPDNLTQDTNSYMARVDYIIPEIYPKFMLNVAYTHIWLNPINQKRVRGIEATLNPSMRLTRTVTNKVKATLSYSYSKKNSEDEANFSYEKHVSGLEVRYDF